MRLAIGLAVLGGVAAIASLGENVSIFDIAIGAGIWFAIGYGIGSLIWRRSRDADQRPIITSENPYAAYEPNPPAVPAGEAPGDPASRSEIAQSLRRLKALHDEGILTDDEYESKRRALTYRL